MFDNNFKSQLLTFKRLNDGRFEILHQSNEAIFWASPELNSLNLKLLDDFFSIEHVSLLDCIFKQLGKSDHFKTPFLLNSQSFLWLKIEGCIVPHGDHGFLVNAMINQI